MKKVLINYIFAGACLIIPQSAHATGGMDFSPYQSEVGRLQNPYQDLKLLEQDRFRNDEYNEFDDMKKVKKKRNDKIKYEQKLKELEKHTEPSISGDVQMYMENGQLKLKNIQ